MTGHEAERWPYHDRRWPLPLDVIEGLIQAYMPVWRMKWGLDK